MKNPRKEFVRLGSSPNRIGYWDFQAATSIVLKDGSALTAMTKEIYEPTAAKRNVEWGCVEASMRKTLVSIWQNGNRPLLQKIMQRTLPEPPTVGDFLGAFALYLESDEPGKENAPMLEETRSGVS